MAFDECPPADAPMDYQLEAVERTLRWARLCQEAHARPNDQSLLGIVQGGVDLDLRRRCAEALIEMDFPGYAVGGLAVGEGFEAMVKVLEAVVPMLPEDRPRYLMGVGYPRDIVAAVAAGIDMFDCVLPTRNGRNGLAFTYGGAMRLRNAKYALDKGPLEAGCDCYCCMNFSRGYVRHMFSVEEMLGPTLVSIHNLRFFQRWMGDIRTAIREGRLGSMAAPGERVIDEAK
jgi:queuine tRNA-ribosyltransferase